MAAGFLNAIGSGALQSLTGNVETAMLVIYDYREAAEKARVDAGNAKMDAFQSNLLNSYAAERMEKTAEALNAATSGGTIPASSAKNSVNERIFNVRFNPSELTLNAMSDTKNEKDLQSDDEHRTSPAHPRLDLTVKLLFDDVDVYDSFMLDKFTGGASVQGLANAGKSVMDTFNKGAKHTVQPQVEALVGALRNPFTRVVSFRWADFSFTGQLTTANARYTMFSTSGRPVKAEVLLRIQHEINDVMLRNFYGDFKTAFSRTSTAATKAQQYSQNLINLNL